MAMGHRPIPSFMDLSLALTAEREAGRDAWWEMGIYEERRVGGAYFWIHSFERQLVPAKHLALSVLIEAVGNFIACLGWAAIEQSDL